MTAKEALDLPVSDDVFAETGARTIKEYFQALLTRLWIEGEGFTGKRPFGNSGWEDDLIVPLVKANVVEGSFDSDGYLEDYDEAAARKAVFNMIKAL